MGDNRPVSTTARSVLVVDATGAVPAAFAAALRPHDYWAESCASGSDALALACTLPYDLVVLAAAGLDTGLRDFVRRLRGTDSASRSATLLVIVEGPLTAVAYELLGHGVNRVVAAGPSAPDLARAVLELAEASPRLPLRAVLRLHAQRGPDRVAVMCQTEDVSATGVFVRTEMAIALGSEVRFELTVPGQVEPIRGAAEVARQVAGHQRQAPGIGLRFLRFDADGGERLRALLAERSRSAAAEAGTR